MNDKSFVQILKPNKNLKKDLYSLK